MTDTSTATGTDTAAAQTAVAADATTETGAPITDAETTSTETPPTAAELAKWKAMSRKNEDLARANAEKAKQFDALEEANKTEMQKAQETRDAALKEAADAKLDALRARTSATTGVPENLLAGTTAEELQASADAAIAWRTAQETTPVAPRVGGAEIGSGAAKPVLYTREQISDPVFYQAHKADILAAQQQGRIST